MANHLILQAAIVAIGALVYYHIFYKKTGPSLPPGPKGLPIVGNFRDLPPVGKPEYQHWIKFKDTYGPISSITVFGQTLVVIHDPLIANELLEKSSLKTSMRPTAAFAADLCGYDSMLTMQQYGDTFRHQRKLIHQSFGTKTVASQYDGVQDLESFRLLVRALDDPKELMTHIKKEAGAIILNITYGYVVEPHKSDPLVSLIELMMSNFSKALLPLSWAIDVFPFLKNCPEFIPGASSKKTAREWKKITTSARDLPYSFVREQMEKGTHKPSYVSTLVSRYGNGDGGSLRKDDECAIKFSAGTIFGGGADTTVSTVMTFVLAMMVFPEVQKKAQQEIDRVVGSDRLPSFEDREHLPYVSGLIKECLRWLPVLPIIPTHATDSDLICKGYRIPKGAYILSNVWWFFHNPKVYPDPFTFQPERFLAPRNEPDPSGHAFGYGRRICPGRYLAENSLYITISRLLATFNVNKAVDENGVEIDPPVENDAGLISHPVAYPFQIKPRSPKYVELIRALEPNYPWEESDSGFVDGRA